jgi:Holliday junction resolvasome RuvABC endonuclease subunit
MGSLSDLVKPKAKKVLGIDASTHSIAFCLMDENKPVKWGEVIFEGDSVYERILDAKKKVHSVKQYLDYDFIALEAAVSVKSVATGLKMAYVFGTIIGELIDNDIKIIEVHPLKWQGFINNPNFTKSEKEAVKKEFPGKTDSWYKNKVREKRKQKTIDFVRTLGVNTDNNNVADATGIAWWAVNEAV